MLKSKILVKFLKKDPEAYICFVENPHYGHECTVNITDFEYDAERRVFILPNLCACMPEPD